MDDIYVSARAAVPLSALADGLTFGDVEGFEALSSGDQLRVCERIGSNIRHALTHIVPMADNDTIIDVGDIDPSSTDDARELVLSLR